MHRMSIEIEQTSLTCLKLKSPFEFVSDSSTHVHQALQAPSLCADFNKRSCFLLLAAHILWRRRLHLDCESGRVWSLIKCPY